LVDICPLCLRFGHPGRKRSLPQALITKRPGLLDVSVAMADETVRYLRSDAGLALDAAEVVSVVERTPALLNLRSGTVAATVAWMLGEEYRGDASREEVRARLVSNPALMTASLDGRIRPRHALLRARAAGDAGRDWQNAEEKAACIDLMAISSLHWLAVAADHTFAAKIGVELSEVCCAVAGARARTCGGGGGGGIIGHHDGDEENVGLFCGNY
jgi:hypothetical protein